MVSRDASSDSEMEDRHDRFRSERNPENNVKKRSRSSLEDRKRHRRNERHRSSECRRSHKSKDHRKSKDEDHSKKSRKSHDKKHRKSSKTKPDSNTSETKLISENNDNSRNGTSCNSSINDYGPILPSNVNDSNNDIDVEDIIKTGHKLNLITVDNKIYGPVLPKQINNNDISISLSPSDDNKSSSQTELFGPALPPGLVADSNSADANYEEDDDTLIGPQIDGKEKTLIQRTLDARAELLKIQMENKDKSADTTNREEWMLELPKHRCTVDSLGLMNRKFKTKNIGDSSKDNSIWTDTPTDKAKKQRLLEMGIEENSDSSEQLRLSLIKERDKEMEKVSKASKKHSKSLLEKHQEKLKKKKKREGEQKERRPFDRDIDLGITRVLNSTQKAEVMKKAQLLNSKFSTGESKFL